MSTGVPASVALEGGVSLEELARATGGRLCGAADLRFHSLSTDTRALSPGDLFVALRGPNFDAHGFLDTAQARGASAVLIDRPASPGVPAVLVDDTRTALGRLASWWRGRYAVPIAGITGSNGKTTVKEMLASILSAWGEGTVTRGNLNNEIGVPLTLLGLSSAHRYAVIEMGARAAGDIAYLCAMTRPGVVLVTNAASAHLAGFGDVAGVARAKGEIFTDLGADSIAVINQDDDYAALWRQMAGSRRVLGFGMTQPADITARGLKPGAATGFGTSFELCMPEGGARIELPMPGRHNVMNALAAAAVAHAMGATLEQIVRGLQLVSGAPHRLQLRDGVHGARIIDDTYNANPDSVAAALEVLAGSAGGAKILALGDMGELGAAERELHAGIGRRARAAGVGSLHAVGGLAAAAAAAFGEGAHRHPDHQALIQALRRELGMHAGATVLVKGSRSMRMERVVEGLLAAASDGVGAPGGQGAAGPLASGWFRRRED